MTDTPAASNLPDDYDEMLDRAAAKLRRLGGDAGFPPSIANAEYSFGLHPESSGPSGGSNVATGSPGEKEEEEEEEEEDPFGRYVRQLHERHDREVMRRPCITSQGTITVSENGSVADGPKLAPNGDLLAEIP